MRSAMTTTATTHRAGQQDADADEIDDLARRARPGTATRSRRCWPRSGRGRSTSAAACCRTPPTPRTPARRRCSTSRTRSAPGRPRPLHHLDARGRGQHRPVDVPPDEEPGEASDPQRVAADAAPDPRTTSVIAGTRLDLLEAMETLERDHPQFVEPLLLRDVYGLSYDEIAEQVGAPLGTVKAQIHHGRKLVRPLLRGSEDEAPVAARSLRRRCSWPAARRDADPPAGDQCRRRPAPPAARRPWPANRPADADDPALDAAERAGRGLGLPRGRRPRRRRAALRPRPRLDARTRARSTASRRSTSGRPHDADDVPARPRRRRSRSRRHASTAPRSTYEHTARTWSSRRRSRGPALQPSNRYAGTPEPVAGAHQRAATSTDRLDDHRRRRGLDDAGAVRRLLLVRRQRPAVRQGALRLHITVPVARGSGVANGELSRATRRTG